MTAGFAQAQSANDFIQIPSNQQTPSPTLQNQILTKVQMNGQATPYVGRLMLDEKQNTMQLQVMQDPCHQLTPSERGTIKCMAMPMQLAMMTAPLETKKDACGSVYYSGSMQNPDDNSLIQIDVANHSQRVCDDLLPSTIMVQAAVINAGSHETMTYEMQK